MTLKLYIEMWFHLLLQRQKQASTRFCLTQYLTIQMKTLMAIQFRVCNEVGLVLHHLSIKSRYKQTVVYEVPISGLTTTNVDYISRYIWWPV